MLWAGAKHKAGMVLVGIKFADADLGFITI